MKNNFDFLRLLFALFVVIAHSYPLSGNHVSNQWICNLTNNQIELSNIGLNGFFILSGYLIYQSSDRSTSFYNYFWKRIIRIFPALIVVLLLTLVLSPILYDNPKSFFKNRDVYTYFFRNISLYQMQFDIKGVFDNNPYPSAINGSLWTIPYEFTLYIFLSFFIFISNNIFKKILILTSFLVMYFGSLFYLDELSKIAIFDIGFLHLFNLGTFFVGGAVLASFKFEIILNNRKIKYLVLLFLFFTILLTIKLEVYNSFKHLFLTLFILLFGLMSFYPINNLHKIGDYSYGIYIYSFPIQQTLMYYFKFSTGKLICYSVLISLLFGVLSWFFVEKKLLAFKNRFN